MLRRLTIAGLALALTLTAWAPSAGASRPRSTQGERISFGTVTCAPGWQPLNPGPARFGVTNRSGRRATVYLFHSDSGAIAATLSDVPAGATRTLRVTLRAGASYTWSCDLAGAPIHLSDAQSIPRVSQAGAPSSLRLPVDAGQLIGPLKAWRRFADRTLSTLRGQLIALAGDLHDDNLAGAETDWLTAHLSWLTVGQDDGAYGAFAALGASIDGTSAGLVGGTASPAFTGFHRIESDLFRGGDLAGAEQATAHLQALIARITPAALRRDTLGTPTNLTTFLTRPHEVLEDALRDTLSGDDDYGSSSGVASLTADVSATREFLTVLAPLLAPRTPQLVATARAELRQIDTTAEGTRDDGAWVAVTALPERQREALDARVDAALETLAEIPGTLALGRG